MRYYKGDTLMTIRILPTMMSSLTVNGEGRVGVIEEHVTVARRGGICRISSKMREGAFMMRGPIGPAHMPLGIIETTEVTMVWDRPWYNHLRAIWDNIWKR